MNEDISLNIFCEDINMVSAAGKDTIFHCATAAPAAENLGNQRIMQEVNVTGTENILKAAALEGVRKVVYTSTASVVFDGKDLNGVDESAPYVKKPLDYYTGTKVGRMSEWCACCFLPGIKTQHFVRLEVVS